ncbi:hypothetical protein TRFO_14521 [Tritrichomonas foetus]|uniref:SP-RING-type domain-containing protein n=1 Tax=Tritrichomonas foetus TaxID=1144522 RepID=A0A1J4KZK2_9EUKA|nr:hypothetical protein TRFO_14521 [Tritrichomonas foetus]|eukprot:OHT15021.1 hypothetical protein TRFO_14521 [Tritrichomonas foetus]
MNRRSKKRAMSDMDQLIDAPATPKVKRRNTERQARLISFPVYYPFVNSFNQFNQNFNYNNYSQNNVQNMPNSINNSMASLNNGGNFVSNNEANQLSPNNFFANSRNHCINFNSPNQISHANTMSDIQNINNFNVASNNSIGLNQMYATNSPSSHLCCPPPQVTKDSIFFSLLPNANLPFNFTIDISNGLHVTMTSTMVSNISFMVNQISYYNCVLPIDLTTSLTNGQNIIVFSTLGIFQPISVQLKIDHLDINAIVQNIINNSINNDQNNNISVNSNNPPDSLNMNGSQINKNVVNVGTNNEVNTNINNRMNERSEEIKFDPFATLIDPITKKKIEVPARGTCCAHYQCFDLKNFVETATKSNNWNCPVCSKKLSLQSLQCDRNYMSNAKPSENGISDDVFDDFLDGNNMDDIFQTENYY